MKIWERFAKRIAYDGLGYIFVLASPFIGWLPGPGGIALFLAGMGLLAVHNPWAKRLKQSAMKHGGKVLEWVFPQNSKVEWTYDILALSLLALASYLIWSHAFIWQITVGVSAFFLALFIASMNRDRLGTRKKRRRDELARRFRRS